MKKYILVIATLSLIPSVAFAAWWNPMTWFQTNNSVDSQSVQVVSSKSQQSAVQQKSSTSESSTVVPAASTTSARSEQISNLPTVDETSSQSKINSLTTQISSLESKLATAESQVGTAQGNYALCQANLTKAQSQNVQVQTPAPAPIATQTSTSPSVNTSQNTNTVVPETVAQRNTPFDYSNYLQENVSDYVTDPAEYLDWGIELTAGQIVQFHPEGLGVVHNYVEITDGTVSSGNMMLEVDNANTYYQITEALKIGDLVNVYGVGVSSQQFTNNNTNASTPATYYEPVLTLQEINKCIISGTNIVSAENYCRGNTDYVFMQTQ